MKPLAKKIVLISSFLLIVIGLTVAVLLLTRPSAHNSFVRKKNYIAEAAEYVDSIETYKVFTFEDYSEFARSEWANAKFKKANETLKEYDYSESFFKGKKLALIAFTFEYERAEFVILNDEPKAGGCEVSVVALYPDGAEKTPSTYLYFYETDKSLPFDFSFSIVASYKKAEAVSYNVKDNDEYFVLEGESDPAVYRLRSYDDALAFSRESDEGTPSMVFMLFLRNYAKKQTEQSDAIILRFNGEADASEGGCLSGNELVLWEISDDNKSGGIKKEEVTKLVMILVPKDAEFDSLRYIRYQKGSDPAVRSEEVLYDLARVDAEGITKYDTEKRK